MLFAGLVLCAQLLIGLWASCRTAHALRLGVSGFLALWPLLGLAILSVATLVVGHVGLLGPWLVWSLAGAGAVLIGVDRRRVGAALVEARGGAVRQWRRAPVSVSAVGLGLGLALVASFAPPFRVDEIEYHWAAPLEWAAEGRWIASSYRHVDSFPLMEIAYTAAATVGSNAGAHLMHLSTLVALGCAAALAARAVGVAATGAVAAGAMAMPVMWDQAYVAYNDTAAGAFSVAAAAVALLWVDETAKRGRLALICVLLATAISIKPTAVGAVGVVGLIFLISEVQRHGFDRATLGRVLRSWTPLIATAVLVLAFWTFRRFIMTGTWIDPALTTPPSADELTRLPTTTDQLLTPVMPFVLGLVGAQEPWGGRIGLVILILLVPAIIFAVWRAREVGARFLVTAGPAWVHWLVVGLAGVRTRFHVVSWALLVVGIRSVAEAAVQQHRWLRPWLAVAWAGAVVLGVVDVSMEMVRAIRTIEW